MLTPGGRRGSKNFNFFSKTGHIPGRMAGCRRRPMPEVTPDSAETVELLDQVRQGDRQALERLLAQHRSELLGFVEVHLDSELNARFDPSDVVQEAHVEAVRRMDDF